MLPARAVRLPDRAEFAHDTASPLPHHNHDHHNHDRRRRHRCHRCCHHHLPKGDEHALGAPAKGRDRVLQGLAPLFAGLSVCLTPWTDDGGWVGGWGGLRPWAPPSLSPSA